ncbi:MAG: hypothetical protein IJT37_00085 [Lachnospiraceae bacterium]|nr:hypothetical protein [Lachnospiraceae bacterium]
MDPIEINKGVGKRISVLRRYKGYSQEYISEVLGMSEREYRRLKRGGAHWYQVLFAE